MAVKLSPTLIPPDLNQCQAEKPNGNTFMTLGGKPGRIRCTAIPKVLVTEMREGPDGLKGSMALCAVCVNVLINQGHPQGYTIEAIER